MQRSVPMKRGDSYAIKLRALQATCEAKAKELAHLQRQRERLSAQEELLLRSITEQQGLVDMLAVMASQHLVADLTSRTPRDHSALAQLAELMESVQARQQALGKQQGQQQQHSCEPAPYTSRVMEATITPDAIAAIRTADLAKDVVPRLSDLTMRMSMLLYGSNAASAGMLSEDLDSKVDEYTAFIWLLHSTADGKVLTLCTLNLETLQEQQPPAGHWEAVADSLQLTEDQAESVSTSFHWYATKRSKLVAQMGQLAQQLQQLLGAQAGAPAAAPAATAVSHAAALAPDGLLHQAGSASSSSSRSSAAESGGSLGVAGEPAQPDAWQQAFELLRQLDSLNGQVREIFRLMALRTSNILTKRQLACTMVHAWPWLPQPTSWAACVHERNQLIALPTPTPRGSALVEA